MEPQPGQRARSHPAVACVWRLFLLKHLALWLPLLVRLFQACRLRLLSGTTCCTSHVLVRNKPAPPRPHPPPSATNCHSLWSGLGAELPGPASCSSGEAEPASWGAPGSCFSGVICSVSDWLSEVATGSEVRVLYQQLPPGGASRSSRSLSPALSGEPSSPSFLAMLPFRRSVLAVTPCFLNKWRSQLDLVEKKASHLGQGKGFWPGDGGGKGGGYQAELHLKGDYALCVSGEPGLRWRCSSI